MSQATSKTARVTTYSRGIVGYRAPELLQGEATFTTKVDIWSIGCILYELVFQKEAFHDDWEVIQYASGNAQLVTSFDFPFPEMLKSHIREILDELLHRNFAFRPTSSVASLVFHSYTRFWDDIVMMNLLPAYIDWKSMSEKHRNKNELMYQLALDYERKGNFDSSIPLWQGLLKSNRALKQPKTVEQEAKQPPNTHGNLMSGLPPTIHQDIRRHLARAYERNGNTRAAVQEWKDLFALDAPQPDIEAHGKDDTGIRILLDLVMKYPHEVGLQDLLSDIYEQQADIMESIAGWEELVIQYPDDVSLQHRLSTAYKRAGDRQVATDGWKKLLRLHPNEPWLKVHLAEEYSETDQAMAVKLFNELADTHAELWDLKGRLANMYQAGGDYESAIRVLEDLVNKHPYEDWVQEQLQEVYVAKGNRAVAVMGWEKLAKSHPKQMWLQLRLANAYQANGDLNAAVSVLRTLVSDHPTEYWLQERVTKTPRAKRKVESALLELELDEELQSGLNNILKLDSVNFQRPGKTLGSAVSTNPLLPDSETTLYENVELSESRNDLQSRDTHGERASSSSYCEGASLDLADLSSHAAIVNPPFSSKTDKDIDWGQQATRWLVAVDRHPADIVLHSYLADVYEASGDANATIAGWKQLSQKYPQNIHFQSRLGNAYAGGEAFRRVVS